MGRCIIPADKKTRIILIIIAVIAIIVALFFIFTHNLSGQKQPFPIKDDSLTYEKEQSDIPEQSGFAAGQSSNTQAFSVSADELYSAQQEQQDSVIEQSISMPEPASGTNQIDSQQGQQTSVAVQNTTQQGQTSTTSQASSQQGQTSATPQTASQQEQASTTGTSPQQGQILTTPQTASQQEQTNSAAVQNTTQQGQTSATPQASTTGQTASQQGQTSATPQISSQQGQTSATPQASSQQDPTAQASQTNNSGTEQTQQSDDYLIPQMGFHDAEGTTPAQSALPRVQRIISPNMVLISNGSFEMDIILEEGEYIIEGEYNRNVTVDTFYISKYEVTQKEYQDVMGHNPSYFKGPNLPVENVSWFNAIEYCNAKSAREGLTLAYTITGTGNDRTVTWNKAADGYRLPTDAEWTYACRANTTTPYNTGNTINRSMANFFGRGTVNVGNYPPNSWGLYDMHGNVSEWCWDLFNSTDSSTNATRVLRGGSWLNTSLRLRSAFRDHYYPQLRTMSIGFRVVQNY